MKPALRFVGTAHPIAYALDARGWLDRLTRTQGRRVRFGNVPDDALAPILATGCDLLWLIGVWRTGANGRRVAIADYEVSPAMGGEEGLARLRGRLAREGVGLLLDYVPNDTALDHPWVRGHPDWYVHADEAEAEAELGDWFRVRAGGRLRRLAHGRDPSIPAWPDTAQLDYRVPEVRRAMTEVLRAVATRCDGVRAEMATLVLDDVFRATWQGRSQRPLGGDSPAGEFWWHAIRAVREAYPDFVMIAEAYWGLEYRLQQLGFDYTYDKVLLDRLQRRDGPAVAAHLHADLDYQRHSLRFLETQDGPRATAVFEPARLRSAALVTATVPGMLLLHDGQLGGARVREPDEPESRPIDEPDPELASFSRRLLDALGATAFRRGTPIRLEPRSTWSGDQSHAAFVAWLWVGSGGSMRLAVANLGPDRGRCFLPLAVPDFAGRTIVFEDLLSDARYERSGDDLLGQGLYLELPAGGHHLFRILGARSGPA